MASQNELQKIRKAKAVKILNQISAKELTNKRTSETRKKILLGAMLQEWVRTGEIEQAKVETGLSEYLTRQQDRDLFGLDKPAGSGEAERAGVKV